MRLSLSSNHFGGDDQLQDAVSYIEHNEPAQYAEFLKAFPEWPNRVMPSKSGWFDTDAMGVDVEWSSWAIDWVESNTGVYWEDGEPWVVDPASPLFYCHECGDDFVPCTDDVDQYVCDVCGHVIRCDVCGSPYTDTGHDHKRYEDEHRASDPAHDLHLGGEGFCLTCGWEPETP